MKRQKIMKHGNTIAQELRQAHKAGKAQSTRGT